MAFLADSNVLLNHIKNCFIYGDDSGLCETIISKELPYDYDFALASSSGYDFLNKTINIDRRSPDIPYDTDGSAIRKSSAEVRMKEVENQKIFVPQDHVFIDTGQWPKILDDEEINSLFEAQEPNFKPKVGKSILHKLLDMDLNETICQNDYLNYSKFSAVKYNRLEANETVNLIEVPLSNEENEKLREFIVYIPDFDSKSCMQNIPIKVTPIVTAKVDDFIGLVCWKYTEENRKPSISKDVFKNLKVQMFEDFDDINMNFGHFVETDPIYKYKFTKLALIEHTPTIIERKESTTSIISFDSSFVTQSHIDRMGIDGVNEVDLIEHDIARRRDRIIEESNEEDSNINSSLINVEIHLSHGISEFKLDRESSLSDLFDDVINRRNLLSNADSLIYSLRLLNDSEVELDMTTKLNDLPYTQFLLIRDFKRNSVVKDVENPEQFVNEEMRKCFEDQIYIVNIKTTFRSFGARIIVGGNCIILDPQFPRFSDSSSSSIKQLVLKQPRPLYIITQNVADCVIIKRNELKNKATLKLLYIKSKSNSTTSSSTTSSLSSIMGSVENIFINNDSNNSSAIDKKTNIKLNLNSCLIKCELDVAKQLQGQIMEILSIKNPLIRRQYLDQTQTKKEMKF